MHLLPSSVDCVLLLVIQNFNVSFIYCLSDCAHDETINRTASYLQRYVKRLVLIPFINYIGLNYKCTFGNDPQVDINSFSVQVIYIQACNIDTRMSLLDV